MDTPLVAFSVGLCIGGMIMAALYALVMWCRWNGYL